MVRLMSGYKTTNQPPVIDLMIRAHRPINQLRFWSHFRRSSVDPGLDHAIFFDLSVLGYLLGTVPTLCPTVAPTFKDG